jgi:hypothetical protein
MRLKGHILCGVKMVNVNVLQNWYQSLQYEVSPEIGHLFDKVGFINQKEAKVLQTTPFPELPEWSVKGDSNDAISVFQRLALFMKIGGKTAW